MPLQYPGQHFAVACNDSIKPFAGDAIKAALFFRRCVLQQSCAHHRRERQRHDGRNQDRHGQCNREFAKQSPDHITHEQEWDQHRDQRKGQRNNRETDLLRTFERGLHRAFTLFNIAGNIFDHHNRVIDHKASRNRQRHQGQIVDRKIAEIHHGKRTDQRKRHRDTRNDGGRHIAQEHEYHHHHQRDRQQQLELHILDRGANGDGSIGQYHHVNRRRQGSGHLRQQLLDAIDHLDHICAGLSLHVQHDRLRVVHPRREFHVLRVLDHIGNVGQIDRCAALIGDHDLPVFFNRAQLIVGVDRVSTRGPVKTTLGLIHVGRRNCGAYIFKIDAGGRQCFRVRLHAHCGPLAAGECHESHTLQLRNLLRDACIDQILHGRHLHRFRGDTDGQDRRIGRIHFAVDRRRGQIIRQQIAPRVDCRLHLLFGNIERQRQFKLQRDDRCAARTGG